MFMVREGEAEMKSINRETRIDLRVNITDERRCYREGKGRECGTI
jgi:hypothetical protein